jgi:formate dehydrogenase subunit gamma
VVDTRCVENSETLTIILEGHRGREGPLLPILHDVQAAFGCIDENAVRVIATDLNLTRAEVHGVETFYHDFRAEKLSRPCIKLCEAEACQARGVATLRTLADAQSRVEVEAIYCLGLCSVGPAAMQGHNVHARLDATSFAALMSTAS